MSNPFPKFQVTALQKLNQIKPAFEVWDYGRREDSEARGVVTKNKTPVLQPAQIFPGLPLYLGDLDDAANVQNLMQLGLRVFWWCGFHIGDMCLDGYSS